ncbi:MAG: hypothetical protein KAW14_00560 [Candidatus Aegiribacteria sp.]|nr:hypothetical protein [Candidatus Aegiribacteria sp.]
MLPLMFAAALVDTVIAPPADLNTIYVHEWGAITFAEEVIIGAAPPSDPLSNYTTPDEWDELLVRAPVVYFYGATFQGTFTVTVPSGTFIETWPVPEKLTAIAPLHLASSSRAVWTISGTSWGEPGTTDTPAGRHELSFSPEILDIWRWPPSFLLEFGNGIREKFIYYECALRPQNNDDFYPALLTNDGTVLSPEYHGELIRFIKSDGKVIIDPITGRYGMRREIQQATEYGDILETLCSWAGGTMKSDEINAMWTTWEDWIYNGSWSGDTLLVFPLPDETVERMSSITLETSEEHDIEYSRFYVGILSN